MSFSDRTLTCRDCGQQFTFTSGEQEFYQSRGLTNDPGRCPECRAANKATRGGGGGGGGYAYTTSTGYGSGGGGYDRPRREVFAAARSHGRKENQGPLPPP